MEKHEEIFKILGALQQGQDFLVLDAKKKNGYIKDIYQRIDTNDKEMIKLRNDNSRLYEDTSRVFGNVNLFLKKQEDKERDKKNWFSSLSLNITTYIVIFVIGFLGSSVSLWFWLMVKTYLVK